jgi:hypothetical protein
MAAKQYRERTDPRLDAVVAREWGETLDAYQRGLEDAMAEHLARATLVYPNTEWRPGHLCCPHKS